jgi:hypothetical protein
MENVLNSFEDEHTKEQMDGHNYMIFFFHFILFFHTSVSLKTVELGLNQV